MPVFVTVDHGGGTGAATGAGVTTKTPNNLLLARVVTFGSGAAFAPIASVSDTAGLIWARRSQVQLDASDFGGGFTNDEIWWAIAPNALAADHVTVTASDPGASVFLFLTAWDGVDPLTPFDASASLPATRTDTSSTVPTIAGISTASPGALVYAIVFDGAASTGNPGDGFTSIPGFAISTASDAQYRTFDTPQEDISVAFGAGDTGNPYYLMAVDALRPARSEPSDFCPALADSINATAALLPRGRAWPANDQGLMAQFLAWLAALPASPPPTPAQWPPGYVQAGFIAALGTVRNWIEGRFCALRKEFWCASASQTLDLWMAEYALPDACDPFPNLCAKVAATGGAQCSYFAAIAETAGWAITCVNDAGFCGSSAGAALAGAATAGSSFALGLTITVMLAASPAYSGGQQTQPLAGLLLAGMTLNCAPNINSLQCLLERVLPAHIPVTWVTE